MMFKDKYIHKLYAFALAAVFTLTLAGCGGGGGGSATTTPGTTPMPDPAIAERAAISGAIDAAEAAVGMVNDDASDATVAAADAAIAAAKMAIADAANIPAEEKAANSGTVDVLANQLDSAKMARQTAIDDANDAARMEMIATAMKLFDGIGATPSTGTATFADGDLDIAAPTTGATTVDPPALEATDTMVEANSGWQGKEYGTATYTAVVYSNPGEETVRDFAVFSSLTEVTNNAGDGIGEYTVATGNDAKVGGSGFTHTSGQEEYELVGNERRKIISGTFDGVAGTYYCAPTDATTNCSATVAATGFTLGGGTWTFKPNAGATIPAEKDANYLAYGWWLQKDGNDWTAGAFTAVAGTGVVASASLGTLQGTATYSGGAAGKYALSNALGGPNVAGHFTADVELEASFGATASVSGSITNFVTGHDNDWEVSLNAANLTDAGGIEAETGNANKAAGTTWNIGGDSDGTGSWSGTLYGGTATAAPNEGTGTFTAVHGRNARMVGAFGVTKQ